MQFVVCFACCRVSCLLGAFVVVCVNRCLFVWACFDYSARLLFVFVSWLFAVVCLFVLVII